MKQIKKSAVITLLYGSVSMGCANNRFSQREMLSLPANSMAVNTMTPPLQLLPPIPNFYNTTTMPINLVEGVRRPRQINQNEEACIDIILKKNDFRRFKSKFESILKQKKENRIKVDNTFFMNVMKSLIYKYNYIDFLETKNIEDLMDVMKNIYQESYQEPECYGLFIDCAKKFTKGDNIYSLIRGLDHKYINNDYQGQGLSYREKVRKRHKEIYDQTISKFQDILSLCIEKEGCKNLDSLIPNLTNREYEELKQKLYQTNLIDTAPASIKTIMKKCASDPIFVSSNENLQNMMQELSSGVSELLRRSKNPDLGWVTFDDSLHTLFDSQNLRNKMKDIMCELSGREHPTAWDLYIKTTDNCEDRTKMINKFNNKLSINENNCINWEHFKQNGLACKTNYKDSTSTESSGEGINTAVSEPTESSSGVKIHNDSLISKFVTLCGLGFLMNRQNHYF